MRKLYQCFLLLLLSLMATNFTKAQVVISQVYGGGGNAGSVYTNDFIELFNSSDSPVDLAGWSVQYASATGSSWQVTSLSGTLAPGQYYLVQQGAGAGGTTPLPTPDATGNINMSGTAGKVALVSSTTALTGTCVTGVVDLVGFGTTASCFEGNGRTPAPSNTNAVLRANGGCTDTDNNDADFATGLPNPRNTSSPTQSCIACAAPSNAATVLSLTAAINSIEGSFTAAASGTVPADGYLILVGTDELPTAAPVSGNSYATGAAIGNTSVVAAGSNTSFTATGLNANTTYYFFIYSYSSTGICYQLANVLSGSTATLPNPAPSVTVAAGTAAAEPATNGSFSLSLSAPAPAGGVTISYTLSGTAQQGSDFTDPQNGSINIPEGASVGTIEMLVVDDSSPEPTKTIVITLQSADNGYVLGSNSASIELTDEDVPGPISLVTTYSQDFDGLASTGTGLPWNDNATIPGWYASRVVYNSGTGSSNAGALYSFGSTGSTDRALGSVGSGSTGTIFYGIRLQNNTGGPITALKVTYTGEQWRNGGNATPHVAAFAYQVGSTVTSLTAGSWTPVTELNFTGPVANTSAAALDGNLIGTNATVLSYTINGLNIAAGDEFMIRWEDPDNSGADHGLAIDDFTIEANPVDLTPPSITSLSPADDQMDVAVNSSFSITFDEAVVKGNGQITIRRSSDGSAFASFDINDNGLHLSGNSLTWQINGLEPSTAYYVEISDGLVLDLAGNNLEGITGNEGWNFTTGNRFFVADFNTCGSSLANGFTQFSVNGAIVWACTPFGRDPQAPAGTAAFPTALQINGFAAGTNVPNTDWLISPSLDLTQTSFPLLSFWSRTAFNGLPLQLKISTDYNGGDPATATWTDLNGKFPQQASNIWTLSENINLSAFKASNVHIAWVYISSDEEGARWTIDDVSLANSPVAPPPSLTIQTSSLQFPFVAAGNSVDRSFQLIGNDLTEGLTLSTSAPFLLSKDGVNYSSSIAYTLSEANNQAISAWARFVPTENNQNFEGKITVIGSGLEDSVSLNGTSINPLTTLEVVNWNVEWFGSAGNGPVNDAAQEQNVRTILQNIDADVYALVEVVDESRLASVVSQMPGYSYVISDFGSHTNPFSSQAGPLSDAQKLAFVYKTSILSNVSAEALLSRGINSAVDISNPNYNAWSSGRFPYMLTADVTLNCVTQRVRFVLVHAKANTSPTATSYERRKNGADSLYSYLNSNFPDENIIILGDFNDDLDLSITAGFTNSSWNSFTNDLQQYDAITLPLSLAGKKSTVSYSDMIDHVVISNEMQAFYMPFTATVLSDAASLVPNFGSSTSDHYPVFSRYRFQNTTAPTVEFCPPVQTLCASEDGNYSIPAFTAVDDCGQVNYQYVITGATERSGSGNDASGSFAVGTSLVVWTATDSWGNATSCSTTVVVNPAPIVTIADAYALPSGTEPNTVYIGYGPASSINLVASVQGGNSGYTFNWSTGSASASISVAPTSTSTYSVTATDTYGCEGTASVQIQAKDIRAGNNKVKICFRPGAQNLTMTVPTAAVPALLAQGAQLGACEPLQVPRLDLHVSPNPSPNQFQVKIQGGQPGVPVSIKVVNVLGKVIEQRQGLLPGQTITLGQNYRNGIYFIEAVQSQRRAFATLIKLGWN